MLPQIFVILGTIIGSIGGIGYLIDVIKGKVRPNRVSFLLWAINPLIVYIVEIKQQVGLSSIMVLSQSVLPLLIFIVSFINKKSEWKLTRFDIYCGILSLVGILLWGITQKGDLAIVFSILADALAAIPTIRKAYKHPETEVAWPWFVVLVGVLLTLFTLPALTFVNSGFLIYLLFCNLIIGFFVYSKIGKEKNIN